MQQGHETPTNEEKSGDMNASQTDQEGIYTHNPGHNP